MEHATKVQFLWLLHLLHCTFVKKEYHDVVEGHLMNVAIFHPSAASHHIGILGFTQAWQHQNLRRLICLIVIAAAGQVCCM